MGTAYSGFALQKMLCNSWTLSLVILPSTKIHASHFAVYKKKELNSWFARARVCVRVCDYYYYYCY